MRFSSLITIYGLCALLCINSVEAWFPWGPAAGAQRSIVSPTLREAPAAYNSYSYATYLPYVAAGVVALGAGWAWYRGWPKYMWSRFKRSPQQLPKLQSPPSKPQPPVIPLGPAQPVVSLVALSSSASDNAAVTTIVSPVLQGWIAGMQPTSSEMRDMTCRAILNDAFNNGTDAKLQDSTIRITTYNVNCGEGLQCSCGIQPKFYNQVERGALASVMASHILILQEERESRAKEFDGVLEKTGFLIEPTGPIRWKQSYGLNNLIATRVPCEQDCFNLPDKDGNTNLKIGGRGCVRVEMPIAWAENSQQRMGKLVVYGTHLSVGGPDNVARLRQINYILAKAKQDIEQGKQVIIAGDLNSVARSDYDEKQWAAIQSMYANRQEKDRIELQTYVTEALEAAGFVDCFRKAGVRPSWTVWNGTRVDFIYLSSNWGIPVKRCEVQKVLGSDHLPVSLDLEAIIREQCAGY